MKEILYEVKIMNDNFVKTNNGKIMCYRLHKDDVVETSVNTLKNVQKKYMGKYLSIKNDETKMIVTENKDDAVAIIEEHILKYHTLKELFNLFVKILFRRPKINDIRFKIIREL